MVKCAYKNNMRKNLPKKRGFAILLMTLGLLVFPSFTLAQTADNPPDGFVVETVTAGLFLPTTFEYAPDGHIFIAEKGGVVRLFDGDALSSTPVIELPKNAYRTKGAIRVLKMRQKLPKPIPYPSYS